MHNSQDNTAVEQPHDETSAPAPATVATPPQRAPLDQSFQRGAGPRPAPAPQSLRDPEALTTPSIAFDGRTLSTIEGYNSDTRMYVAQAETALDSLREGLQQIINAREASKKNPTWNEAAQVLAVADLAAKVQAKTTPLIDTTLANMGKSIAGMEEMLRAPITVGASTPIASDVCLFARGLDASERMKLLTRAIEKSDLVTLGAVLGRPAYLSGLTDEMQATLTVEYNRKKAPETARRIAVMKEAHERLSTAGSLFVAHVEKAMGVQWGTAQKLKTAKADAERAFV